MASLAEKKLFLFDLDGTLYLDGILFKGTLPLLAEIERRGARSAFVTNNSSRSSAQYAEKLAGLGIEASSEQIVTSTQASARVVAAEHPGELVYVQGTRAFAAELAELGLDVTEDPDASATVVLLGFDRELTTAKLEGSARLLSLGRGLGGGPIPYYASHPDLVCPTAWGYVPDLGAMAQALEHATGRTPRFIGKPEPYMVEMALERFGAAADEAVFVGDRLYTDIAMGANAGIDSICVLSGEATEADIEASEVEPTWVMGGVADILAALSGNPA